MLFKRIASLILVAVLAFGFAAAAQAAPTTVKAEAEFSPAFEKGAVSKGRVKFSELPAKMLLGSSYRIRVLTSLGSGLTCYLSTSDSDILEIVENGGYYYAVPTSVGKAKLTASIRYNGKIYKTTKTIKVKMPPISAVYVESEASTIVGGAYALHPSVTPGVISGVKYKFTSSNKAVATVDSTGIVTGVKEGNCLITVAAGGKKAQCSFTVQDDLSPADKRAYLFGMSLGDSGYSEFEFDALTSVYDEVMSVYNMFQDKGVTKGGTYLNRNKAELLSYMDGWSVGTSQNDTTYIYYSGHGAVVGGQLCLIAGTDKAVTIKELKSRLDRINGKVVVFLNCCQSGNAIGKSLSEEAFASAVVSEFASSNSKSSELANGKYTVICACKGTQYGYILNGVDVFGDAFTKALGWSLLGKRSTGSWLCDTNGDGKATVTELTTYMRADINAAMLKDPDTAGTKQTLVSYPAKSNEVLFSK